MHFHLFSVSISMIMRPLRILADGSLKRPRLVLAVFLALFAASLAILPRMKIDNSVDVFFDKDGTSYRSFQRWKDQFGSDELVIVAFSDKDIFTPRNLRIVRSLTDRIKALDHVADVTSLTSVNTIVGSARDFTVRRLIEEIPATPEALARLRREALSDPLYVKNIVSSDGRTAAVIAELEGPEDDDSYKKETIRSIRGICREVMGGRPFHLSGLTVIEHVFAAYMQDDLKTFMPLMILIIAAVLYASFRRVRWVLLPLAAMGVSLACALALLCLFGFSMNNVTTIIPPILMAIMLADSIHLLAETLNRRTVTDRDRLAEGLRKLAFPCFLTTFTTAIGFFSLAVSRIPPVKELGIVVGWGVFIALIVTFTFLPALIVFTGGLPSPAGGGREGFLERVLPRLGDFVVRRHRMILAAAVFLAVACTVGLLRIRAETSVIEYFRKDSPIYQDTIFIERHLSGVHTVNISLEADRDDAFLDPKALHRIERLEAFLATLPEVDKVNSFNDYVKEIHKSFYAEDPAHYRIPDSRPLIAQFVLLYGETDIYDYIDERHRWTTLRVRLNEHSTVKLERVLRRIQDHLDRSFADWNGRVVGQTALEVESNNTVTSGQIRSLGLAMALIFGMMFFVFRSVSLGLISIVPNILPVLINFGLMGWSGVRLDSATSMIAAIGIGIVVDDTIHFLHAFKERMKAGDDHARAVRAAVTLKGRPIIVTSLVLFFGFGVLGLSRFVPTSCFGGLSALLMLNALIADLLVLPALLLWARPLRSIRRSP